MSLLKNKVVSLGLLLTLMVVATLLIAGDLRDGSAERRAEAALLGGTTTVFASGGTAFGFKSPTLNEDEELNFFVGNSLFNQNWVSAPASTKARDGLGPLFNSRSCSGCHLRDGRGRPPAFAGERSHGLLMRISIGTDPFGHPIPDPYYGDQIQDQAIAGFDAEAELRITHDTVRGAYADGSPYELLRPVYYLDRPSKGTPTATQFSPRVANHIIGMGLLEAIPEEDLLAIADPEDADGDGISGRLNYVPDVTAGETRPGRFGWKASQPTVLQQVASAFAGDIGITSDLYPEENCSPSIDCADLPDDGEPQIDRDRLEKVTLYSSTLGVPAQRDVDNPQVIRGAELFEALECGSCHTPAFTTGEHSFVASLSGQTIRPYTDLLLHDMGPELADNRPEYRASGREWRTPPLWGVGLFPIVNKHSNYLHDGRARNLTEAILWHGGEARASRDAFVGLPAEDRAALVRFIQSL